MRRLLIIAALLSSSVLADDGYYEPTPEPLPFDFAGDAPFADYLEATARYLREHRDFIKPRRKKRELTLVMPFELEPGPVCRGPVRGILLVHGILDTPYAMRDMAEVLNSDCFLVRSILLPGHGTRAGDLLTVTADDWLDAVRYGVRTLKRDADEVYVGGFSLGGLLAMHAAIDEPDVRAAVLLAPAFRVTYQLLADQSTWLKHVKDWLDQNPAPLPVRYQSMSTNAVAQVIELIDRYDRKAASGIDVPAYVVTSVADIAVDGEAVVDEFVEHFTNDSSRLEIYGDYDGSDERVMALPGFLPDDRIVNIAHVAMPYRSDDFYYGVDGAWRDCGQYLLIIPRREVAACARADDNWKGELDSTDDAEYLPIQRLTYNPYFDETMQRIVEFLNGQRGEDE